MAEDNKGEAFDWDEQELSDEGGFTVLPEGTYAFEVAKIDRERFEGSEKMAACPRAKVTLNVWTEAGWQQVTDRLMLNTKMAWKIARFFEGLGYAKDPGTGKVPVRWNEAEGRQGYLKLSVSERIVNGKKYTNNEVDAYLKPDEWPAEAQAAAPAPVPAHRHLRGVAIALAALIAAVAVGGITTGVWFYKRREQE